jgi:hypothetical protein
MLLARQPSLRSSVFVNGGVCPDKRGRGIRRAASPRALCRDGVEVEKRHLGLL